MAILAVIAIATGWYAYYDAQQNNAPADPAFVERLKLAHHCVSTFPAPRQTFDLAKKVGYWKAFQNAFGMEDRDVRGLGTGQPEYIFNMLSHLGGYGEIIWVDQWTNFPIKMPTGINNNTNDIRRRYVVTAVRDAIAASDGCLVKAGKDRYLVAKVSEKKQYEAAIRSLGWLKGTPPPWDKVDDNRH